MPFTDYLGDYADRGTPDEKPVAQIAEVRIIRPIERRKRMDVIDSRMRRLHRKFFTDLTAEGQRNADNFERCIEELIDSFDPRVKAD